MNINEQFQYNQKIMPYIFNIAFGMNGKAISMEGSKDDLYYGVDFILRNKKGDHTFATRIRNVGSRIYPDFTIRCGNGTGCEYSKRKQAIAAGKTDEYPRYTLQAWVDSNNQFVTGSLIVTKDLYRYVANHIDDFQRVRKQYNRDGTYFYAVSWLDIEAEQKYKILVVNKYRNICK